MDPLDIEEADAIRRGLEEDNLQQWGFVIFRCTYKSQEKWEKFVTLVKQDVSDFFEWRRMEDLYARMAWTIIEDQTLDCGSIGETSRRFHDWVETEGRQELQSTSSVPEHDMSGYSPRYLYYILMDEESLESVVNDEKARLRDGYFCTIVRSDNVLLREEMREKRRSRKEKIAQGQCTEDGDKEEEDNEDDDDDDYDDDYDEDDDDEDDDKIMGDLRKRVKVDELVSLYVQLLFLDSWYTIWVDEGIAQLA